FHMRAHKKAGALTTVLMCLAFAAAFNGKEGEPAYSSKEFLAPIKYLSGDGLKGRGDGTPGLDTAARYIAGHFRTYGLQAAGDKGSYLQHFTITVGARLGPHNSCVLESDAAHNA